ncbi:MAG: SDR family oxidoreductase [Planctomycetota bacterium]
MSPSFTPRKIAVTGATGYVGGRLVPWLLDAGHEVVCVVRHPRKLESRPWHDRVTIVQNDLSDPSLLAEQLAGCSVAYYLIHSMEVSGSEYAERDRKLARAFASAASETGVERIVYLGGLGEMGEGLSEHLSSRREVEQMLASTDIPVTVFRAAMIIGSGSASFEILRYLVERLPVMVTPRWVRTESQPVAIADVLHWLVRCLDVPETSGRTLEIGGADVIPYRELMQVMAEELDLTKRWIFPLPVLTPRLSSGWISLVTPVGYKIARPLAEGLRNRVVVTDHAVQELMPHDAVGVRAAIRKSIERVRNSEVETRWSVAGPVPGDPEWAGGTVFKDERTIEVDAAPSSVFRAVCRVGGGHGWYAGDLLWRIRGGMDTLVGGPGLRRGRRHPEQVEFGESLDFWRVIGVDRDRTLSLLAEMKLPGTATLEFNVTHPSETASEPEASAGAASTRLTMTARFRPRGILGILYWYSVLPLHSVVFGGMLNGIKRAAEAESTEQPVASGEA